MRKIQDGGKTDICAVNKAQEKKLDVAEMETYSAKSTE